MRTAAILLLMLAANGCDRIYGVSRYAPAFTPAPTSECVVDAIKAVDGVESVDSAMTDGVRRLSVRGVQVPDKSHRFGYVYHGVANEFSFTVAHDGSAEYRHGYLRMHAPVLKEEVERIYPVFAAMEKSIQDRCLPEGWVATIQERCMGVVCSGA